MPHTIAKYLRYSNDDGNTSDSESIKNQRDFLDAYIGRHDELREMETVEFVDDGFTGQNFDRPGFKAMMEAVKRQEVNCIILKDFSRLGRHFNDCVDYLDCVFPFMGVRVIAVNEKYDSSKNDATIAPDMAIQNLIYQFYSKDLSKKVKSARKTLAKRGEYIAPFTFYGYRKSEENKKKIIPDYPAAGVVRRIFEEAASGKKARLIAISLNEEEIPSPNEYHRQKSTVKQHYVNLNSLPLWNGDIIRRIVQDERYTGKMISGKYSRVKGKVVFVPKDEWIVTPNTHEAIVTEELWKIAQNIFHTRKEIIMPAEPKSVFTGMLKCTCCNKTLVMECRQKQNTSFFYCHNFNMGLDCKDARINESHLKEAILAAVTKKVEFVESAEQLIKARINERIKETKAKKRELEQIVKKASLSLKNALEQYLDGQISKTAYQSTKSELDLTIEQANEQLNGLENSNVDISEYVNHHKAFYGAKDLSRDMVTSLISEIRVTSHDKIEIVWAFSDCYQKLCHLVDELVS